MWMTLHRSVFAILLLSTVTTTAAEPARDEVVRLKLRPQVVITDGAPTLGDVLIFPSADEPLRAKLGEQPLGVPGEALPTVITHEQIEQRLRALRVDLTHVLIEGAASCRITPRPAERENAASRPADRDEPRSATATRDGVARTLGQLLREQLSEELSELGGTVELQFEQASQPLVDLTTPPFDFSIQRQERGQLGLREFRVAIRRDGKTQRTASVYARVRLSKGVLVARKPLSVGTFIERDAVGVETRLLETSAEVGFERVEAVVGQQVAKFVAAGQMLRRGDLKSVRLVERSRPVSVIGGRGSVNVRLSGVALDTGSYGDTVRVRVGDARKSRAVVRGVVSGLGTVRVMEEGL